MNSHTHQAAETLAASGAMLLVFGIALIVYLFFCFCNKRICEKCGVEPGILIWIPILGWIPMFWAAQMSGWMILLMLIPIVSLIVYVILWVKVCQARGKGVLAILLVLLLPVIGVPYLAFSE
jgi:hypothetical protein